jgi:predicted RecA/RadA family phage recombinase
MPATVLPVVAIGQSVKYTPAGNVANGDVIVAGSLIAIVTPLDIPGGSVGTLQPYGIFSFPKATSAGSGAALVFGTPVYWDAVNKIASPTSTVGERLGVTVPQGTPADADLTIWVLMIPASGAGGAGLQPAQFTSYNVAGPATFAAGQLTGASFVNLKSTNAAPGTQTTRTATQMYADTPGAAAGMSYMLRITNTGAGTLTLAAGTGVTLTGTMTIATNTFRDFVVTFNTATTLTIQDVGTGTDS